MSPSPLHFSPPDPNFPQISDLLELVESHVAVDTSAAFLGLQKCKHWARVVKESRTPSWPCPPTRDLPPREVADALVECYLNTFETLYRVLHVPSFRRDYEAIWTADPDQPPDMAFIVQVKLIMAIGAATHDGNYSRRPAAFRWIYEGHTWVSNPVFKVRVRPDLVGIQNHILLLMAREVVGVDDDAVWISAGALLREGMYIGLHRDPSKLPRNTRLAAEMRRRLWTTILEVSLQSCLISGSTPHITLDDFDTLPPGNYNDEQLLDDDAAPRPDTEGTSTSVARALRKTFPQRLAVIRLLNDIGARGTYDDTLCIDAELRQAHRALASTLEACCPPDHFAARAADFILRHHLVCLHMPYLGISFRQTSFAYSRKVAVETSQRAWAIAHPSNPDEPLARLVVTSAGLFRTVAFQAAFIIALELKTQLQDDVSLGPAFPRPDLLAVVKDAAPFTLLAIKAGRTNMKGHLLISMMAAQIDGICRGFDKEAMSNLIGRTAVEVEERVLPILQELAVECQTEGEVARVDEPMGDFSVDYMGDWVFFGEECGNVFPMINWGGGDGLASALDY